MPSAAEEYDVNLDSGNSIITRHLRAELENRLVMAINCNDNANADTVDNGSDSIRNTCEQDTVSPKLKFPDNLVSVIAGHVIQESSLEPCGLKGKNNQVFFSSVIIKCINSFSNNIINVMSCFRLRNLYLPRGRRRMPICELLALWPWDRTHFWTYPHSQILPKFESVSVD